MYGIYQRNYFYDGSKWENYEHRNTFIVDEDDYELYLRFDTKEEAEEYLREEMNCVYEEEGGFWHYDEEYRCSSYEYSAPDFQVLELDSIYTETDDYFDEDEDEDDEEEEEEEEEDEEEEEEE